MVLLTPHPLFHYHVYASVERIARYAPPFTEPEKDKYPWIVQQIGSRQRICTGALISDRHVLMAAHCLEYPYQIKNLAIVFPNEETGFLVKAKRFIINPDYRGYVGGADLAIVELEYPVDILTPKVNTDNDQCFYWFNEAVMAAGYQHGTVLRLVELKWNSCSPNSLYILHYPGYGKSGDSGSPLFVQNNRGVQVIGIHSGSYDYKGSPMWYAPLSRNKDFLNKYIEFTTLFSSGSGSGSGSAVGYSSGMAVSKNIGDWQVVPVTSATSTSSATSGRLSFIFLPILLAVSLHII